MFFIQQFFVSLQIKCLTFSKIFKDIKARAVNTHTHRLYIAYIIVYNLYIQSMIHTYTYITFPFYVMTSSCRLSYDGSRRLTSIQY